MEEHKNTLNTHGYIISVKNFEGPIDLMYQLIEKRKMQINTISLASITENYLKHIENFSPNAEEIARFIYVASILILIKSKSLLPILEYTKEEEVDVLNLETLIKLYSFIKIQTPILFEMWGRKSIQTRAPRQENKIKFSPCSSCTADAIHKNALDVLADISFLKEVPKKTVQATIRIEKIIENIMTRVTENLNVSFNDITNTKNRSEVILSFLAVLELARKNLLQLSQNNMFDDIILKK